MAQRFKLIRLETSEQGTFGILVSQDFKFMCYTVEQPWLNNAFNVSCIPTGVYDASVVDSPRFGQPLYRLNDKQTAPRSAILMHIGNWGGDKSKGYKSNFEGCIGLGMDYTDNLAGQKAVTRSGEAFNKFYEYTDKQDIVLEIIETY